jgi:hypothetical protein
MAPNTQQWIKTNILGGRVSDGTFHINLPIETLAAALRNHTFPANSINVQLALNEVKSKYFKQLPALEHANGNARLVDNSFSLTIESASAQLPGGSALVLNKGQFTANDVLLDEVPGEFIFDVSGSVTSLLELTELPDISPFVPAKPQLPPMQGSIGVRIGLKLPLIKDVHRDRVQLTTALTLSEISVPDVVKGVDLTDGKFTVDYSGDVIDVRGPAKIGGVASQIIWRKPKAGGSAVTGIEMVTDTSSREALGIKLTDYMKGPAPVKIALQNSDSGIRADVEADLSKVSLAVSALGWSREPTSGTKVSFSVQQDAQGNRRINDLTLTGSGLRLKGDVAIDGAGRLRTANFVGVKFGDNDYRSVEITPADGLLRLNVEGAEFDARPYISKLATPLNSSSAAKAANTLSVAVSAKFDRIYAFRGEIIEQANANILLSAGKVTGLAVDGHYVNQQPVSVKMTSVGSARELRVTSNDGGATLRAANFYSKIAGGQMQFFAQIANSPGSPIRNGELEIKGFEVRNEAALAELDQRGRPTKSGPRRGGISFKRLTIPFTTDGQLVRMPNIELKGNELGAVAKGFVRKKDGAIDITGTIIPAQGINGALDDIPLFGQILTGGNNEGIFGITFAMGGSISKPKFQMNPLSALAPGIFRKFFEFRRRRPQKSEEQASPY